MYNIDYKIKPIFKIDEQMCKDFAHVELLCEAARGNNFGNVYRKGCEEYYLQTEEDENRFIFAAFYETEIIGFTQGYLKGDNMHLSNFYVNPMYHGYGVGTKLLKTTEDAVSIIRPNLELCPLSSAVSFYQQYKYNFSPCNKLMVKKLPKTITGVVPVFEWSDELQVKSNVKIDCDLLKGYKYQPMFVYIGKNNRIDGVAVRLPNGEQYIKLDEKQKSLAKYRRIELSWALDDCR